MNPNSKGSINFIITILRWKKVFIANIGLMFVVAISLSFIIPKWYTSSTTIIIPSKEGSEFGLSSFMKKLPISGFNLGLDALSDDASLYIAILKSRKTQEAVINRFNLIKRFKSKNIEEALKEITDYYSVKINEEGTITLSSSTKTPYFPTKTKEQEAKVLSRDMAVFFINQLDKINRDLKIEKARNYRIFIEKRYQQALNELQNKENQFKEFQQEHNTILLPEQLTASIKVTSEIKAKILTKQIEMSALQSTFGDNYPEIQNISNEITALNHQFNNLIDNQFQDVSGNLHDKKKDIFFSFNEIPDLGLTYARLMRDVVIQEKIIEFLLPQYEQSKIQEAKDTPTLQTLDEAQLPIRKAKPKRILFVLLIELLTILFSTLFIFIYEYINRFKIDNNSEYLKIKRELSFNAASRIIK